MTGRLVTYRTTRRSAVAVKPVMPNSWPNTTPGKRLQFAANTNRPPQGGPVKAAPAVVSPAMRTAMGAVAAYAMVDALGPLITAFWASRYNSHWQYEGTTRTVDAEGYTVIDPCWWRDYRWPSQIPESVWLTKSYYPGSAKMKSPSNWRYHRAFAWPPAGAENTFQWEWPVRLVLPPNGPILSPKEVADLLDDPAVTHITNPMPLSPGIGTVPEPGPLPGTWGLPRFDPWPYTRPEYPPVPTGNPAISPTAGAVVVQITDGKLDPNPGGARPPRRPPPGVRERKFGGPGAVILAHVARAMGEGLEWLEVFSDAFGYRRRKYGFDPVKLTSPTDAGRRAEFLWKGYGHFSWELFFKALAKKVAEDIVGGAVFRRVVRASRELGITVDYKVTGLTGQF